MTTYTELVTQIRDYTETDSNVLTSVIINDFIEHTENRILRDLDIPIFTSHQYSNFTTSSETRGQRELLLCESVISSL